MVRTITAELLRQRLANGESPILIDTRSESSFTSWHIPGAVNYPYDPDDAIDLDEMVDSTGAETDDEIITICAKGMSSYDFAHALDELGYAGVAVVQDGMRGWSRLYEVAAIPTIATTLEIFQIQRVAKGCLGYVIGSPSSGEAVVVDPTRHIEEFEVVATDDGMSIEHVIDTHVHADHISGGRDLAEATGATYHLPAAAADRDVAFDFSPFERNEVLSLGDIEIKAVATPGHTSDSMSLVIGAEAILTGDTLFVDSVGRTELQFGDEEAATGARDLYQSLHGTILVLPDGVTVLPGHFSPETEDAIDTVGSPISAPIRDIRSDISLLSLDEAAFVDQLTRDLPEKPPNYDRVIAINTGADAPRDTEEATELELGPNRCAVSAD